MVNPNTSFTIIGAGIVGLATALKLKEKLPDAEITILEKENDVASIKRGTKNIKLVVID